MKVTFSNIKSIIILQSLYRKKKIIIEKINNKIFNIENILLNLSIHLEDIYKNNFITKKQFIKNINNIDKCNEKLNIYPKKISFNFIKKKISITSIETILYLLIDKIKNIIQNIGYNNIYDIISILITENWKQFLNSSNIKLDGGI